MRQELHGGYLSTWPRWQWPLCRVSQVGLSANFVSNSTEMDQPAATSKLLSVVVSVYNEEDALPGFWAALCTELNKIAGWDKEVIFVNDGSVDESDEILAELAKNNSEIKAVNFSRNFGHEAAMLAGIDTATGDAIVCMDSDLQHPPECIAEMLAAFDEGHHIVTMVRTQRADHGFFKRGLSNFFYWFLNKISPVHFEPNASDFFLVSKKVAKILRKEYRERTRFLRGYIQVLGFKKTKVEFAAPARSEGESKYSFYKLMLLSTEAIVAFSRMPLHIGLLAGMICAFIGLLVGLGSLIVWLGGWYTPPGYTTAIVLFSFLFSILFFLIGIMGVYLGYVFEETKKRPIYIIDEIIEQDSHED
jgi:glycosyltransferase involved in cell wall biosynthesis